MASSGFSRANSHFPTRSFTPSNPRPHSGHPKPRAITGGKAKGIDEADVKEIERVGIGESAGGLRISVASMAFSGIEKNDGTSYLFALVSSMSFEKGSDAKTGQHANLPVMGSDQGPVAFPPKTILCAVRPNWWVDSVGTVLPAIATKPTEHDSLTSYFS